MTKTLTDKWREGTLPEGCYYVRFFTTKQPYIEICGSEYLGNLAEFNGTDRAEVLSAVPSYDEYKKLVRKSDKLNKIMSDTVTNQGDCQQIVEDNLNRQIERLQKQLDIVTEQRDDIHIDKQVLQKQLNEANNLFLKIQNKIEDEPEETTMTETRIYELIDDYLTKWVGGGLVDEK